MSLIKVKSRGTDNVSGRRNIVINGDMKVAQRNGTTVTQAAHNGYSGPDRWKTFGSGGGVYTIAQDSGHQADTGHDKALKIAVTTADTSIAATDVYSFLTRIESNSLQHLQYGTSSAKSITFSFWVRATKTGTQAVFFSKQGTGTDYNHIKEYTINASNTWEHKTITIPGLTASTMVNDASTYLQVGWILQYGSNYHGTKDTWTTNGHFSTGAAVNNMDSTSNTFYVTGVQLEVGDSASDFEHRSFGEELSLCQRYMQVLREGIQGWCTNANGTCVWTYPLQQVMRTAPTITCTEDKYRYGDAVAIGCAMTSISLSASTYNSDTCAAWTVTGTADASPAQYRNQLLEPNSAIYGSFHFISEL